MSTKSLSTAIFGKFERSLYFVELKYLRFLLVGVKIAKIDSVWQRANKKILIRRNWELNSTNSTNSANLCKRPQKIPVQRAISILAGKQGKTMPCGGIPMLRRIYITRKSLKCNAELRY